MWPASCIAAVLPACMMWAHATLQLIICIAPCSQGPNYMHWYTMPRPGLPVAGTPSPTDLTSAAVATAAGGSGMSDAGEAAAARIADTTAAGMAPGPAGAPVPAAAPPQDPRRPPLTSITGAHQSAVPKPLAAQAPQPSSRPQDPRLAGRYTPPPPQPLGPGQPPPRPGPPPRAGAAPTIKDPKAWSLDMLMSEGTEGDATAWMSGAAGDENKQADGTGTGVQQTLLGGPLAPAPAGSKAPGSQLPQAADLEQVIHNAMHTLVSSNPVLAGVLATVVDLMTGQPDYQPPCAQVIQV